MAHHTNIEHFNDLSEINKTALLQYISDNFSVQKNINRSGFATCYNLKQQFRAPENTQHITSKCFTEAMIEAGFKAVVVDPSKTGDQVRHYFNVYVRKRIRGQHLHKQ